MADRNLEIALRIKADLESARKQLDDLNKSVKATGDNSKASADKLSAVSQRIGEMEAEAAAANKTLGQTDKVARAAATGTNSLGREVAQLASNLKNGNLSGAAGNLGKLGTASGLAEAGVGALTVGVGSAVAILALFAVGAFKGYEESERLRASVIATGGAAGVSATDFDRMAVAVGDATGQYGNARKAVELLAASGKVAGAGIGGLAQQAVNMSIVTGESIDKSVAKILELGDRPAAAIAQLNEQYHFLTAAQYAQIAAMQAEGDVRGAARLANQLDAAAMADRAADVQNNAGLIERAAHAVKSAWDEAWDAIKGVGRTQGLADQVKAVQDAINIATQPHVDPTTGNWITPTNNGKVAALQAKLADLRRQQVEAGFAANAQELDARGNADSIAAQQRTAKFQPANVTRDNAIKQANADRLAMLYGVVDPARKAVIEQTYQNQLKAANDAYDAATKVHGPKARTPRDTTAATDRAAAVAQQQLITMLAGVQGQLDPTAAAWATYNAAVDKANQTAAIAAKGTGANIQAINAERDAYIAVAAQIRDAAIAKLAAADQKAWEQLRASLNTPAEVKIENATAQIAELNRLIASGVDVGGKYSAMLNQIGRSSVINAPQYKGVDAAVSGPAGELIKNLQAQQALDAWHEQQLASNEAFRQRDIANEQAAAAAKLEIDKQYAAQKSQIDQARNELAVNVAQAGFATLANAMQAAYGEQSKQYRIAFALQKASALASAILSIQKSIAASSEIGYPWNIVTIAGAIAQGVGVLATINSTSLGGYSDGGYTGPGGKYQPAGVVHAGEVVWSQQDIARAGGVSTVEAMRLGMRGYADGGFVHPMANAPAPPSIAPVNAPAIAPAAGGQPPQQINQRIVVGLDTSVLDDWANSSSFEKAVKVTISRNPSFLRTTAGR